MRKALLALIPMIFFMSSCGNSAPENEEPAYKPPAQASGESIYKKTCVACHQANGEGVPNAFPPLAKSDYLANREETIRQVIKGKSGEIMVNGKTYNSTMPPQPLSEAEIAAVLTYVYTSFGNTGAPVTVDEVKSVKSKL